MLSTCLAIAMPVTPVSSVHGIRVEGRTQAGAPFSGELAGVDNGYLYLTDENSHSVGIRTDQIGELQPQPGTDIASAAREILHYREILHLWGLPVHRELIAYAEMLASQLEWSSCYQTATRIGSCTVDPAIARAAKELQAWSLFEMGLFQQCAAELEQLDQTSNPLLANTRICRMLALMAMREGRTKQAIFWALIPKLRVPCDNSPVANQLHEICQEWLKSE